MPEDTDNQLKLAIQEKAELQITPDVALYIEVLKTERDTARAELSLQKDHIFGLDDLLAQRPKDRRLAEIMCDWMNTHKKETDEPWCFCRCALCDETKGQMNRIGDPIIHTTEGWKCVAGLEEFKTRNVAEEFTDNTLKLSGGSLDAEVWKP